MVDVANRPDIDNILIPIFKKLINKEYEKGTDALKEAKQALYHRLAAEATGYTCKIKSKRGGFKAITEPALPLSKLKAIMEIKE